MATHDGDSLNATAAAFGAGAGAATAGAAAAAAGDANAAGFGAGAGAAGAATAAAAGGGATASMIVSICVSVIFTLSKTFCTLSGAIFFNLSNVKMPSLVNFFANSKQSAAMPTSRPSSACDRAITLGSSAVAGDATAAAPPPSADDVFACVTGNTGAGWRR